MINCKICNKEFDLNIKLTYHIKNEHNLNKKEYVILTKYSGQHPVCECGCGEKVNWNDKKGFYRFILDHSKFKQKELIKKQRESDYYDINKKLKRYELNTEILKKYYNDYCEMKISMSNIIKEIKIDKRTLYKWWNELNFIDNKDTFKRINKKHQGYWSNKNKKILVNELEILNIFSFMSNNPNLFTITNLKTKFNIKETKYVLYKQLCDTFGKDKINSLVKLGNSSKPEMNLYFILSYYFGSKNITKQFRLENKYFDFKLGDKILIEYDGDYWHSTENAKKNDKIKNDIALNNGYILFRVKEKESKDLEILLKINKLWKKYQK